AFVNTRPGAITTPDPTPQPRPRPTTAGPRSLAASCRTADVSSSKVTYFSFWSGPFRGRLVVRRTRCGDAWWSAGPVAGTPGVPPDIAGTSGGPPDPLRGRLVVR